MIDVLVPEYQNEIEIIIAKFEKFKQTKNVIERKHDLQDKYISNYNSYRFQCMCSR